MKLIIKETSRGFRRADFVDFDGEKCSIQESSLADRAAIWLGCDWGTQHHVTHTYMARMHLTREMVQALIPVLQHFVHTGQLPTNVELSDRAI